MKYNNQERDLKIKQLYKNGSCPTCMAVKYKVSRQRIHQIATGYRSPSRLKSVEKLKIFTKRKLEYLGLPVIEHNPALGGRDRIREIIRARDNWTCQKCFKKWVIGNRRFDVHHLDEKKDGKSRSKGISRYDKNNPDKLITLCHKCHFGLEVTRNRIRK